MLSHEVKRKKNLSKAKWPTASVEVGMWQSQRYSIRQKNIIAYSGAVALLGAAEHNTGQQPAQRPKGSSDRQNLVTQSKYQFIVKRLRTNSICQI